MFTLKKNQINTNNSELLFLPFDKNPTTHLIYFSLFRGGFDKLRTDILFSQEKLYHPRKQLSMSKNYKCLLYLTL